jgi:hypothetical protein
MSVMSLAVNPVLLVKNQTSRDLCIEHDPNWDDQQLFINGKPTSELYCLPPDESARVSIDVRGVTHKDEHMMGVIFTDTKHYNYQDGGVYQTTIGHHPDTQLLDVTDEYVLTEPSMSYTVDDRTDWSATLTFVDF